MLDGNSLVLVALTTLLPSQVPLAPVPEGPVAIGVPVAMPIATAPAMVVPPDYYNAYPGSRHHNALRIALGCNHACDEQKTLHYKLQRIVGFFCYQSVYKMPCVLPDPEPYRPPLYEWFPPCVGGVSYEMPYIPPPGKCPAWMPPVPPGNTCPTCLHRGLHLKLLGKILPHCPSCGAKQ